MQKQISITATVAVLVAASIHSADARAVRSSVQVTACGAGVTSAELRDGHGSCTHETAALNHVDVSRRARSRVVRVTPRGASCGGRLSAVRAHSGAIACVASRAASAFQGFVTALESSGYRIDFMGGWRAHGSCRECNMHPRGLAIDINQTGRNRVTHRFPAGPTELAARYGLLHGAIWGNADTGHFELLSESPTRYAYQDRLGAYASADRSGRRDRRHRTAALTATPAITASGETGTQGSGSGYQ